MATKHLIQKFMPQRMRQTLRRVRRGRKPLILLYHRIGEGHEDPWANAVSVHHFEEHLEILSLHRRVYSLRDLRDFMLRGRVPDDVAVVTFDDGYADNLFLAAPLLARYGTPATIFVTWDAVGSTREFWWDELGKILFGADKLPTSLALNVSGVRYEWELDETGGDTVSLTNPPWRIWHDPPGKRHELYTALWRILRSSTVLARERTLADLRNWARSSPDARSERRTLSLGDLVTLDKCDLIEIGAHGITHSALPDLPPELGALEVRTSKSFLEERLGHSIHSFAYPFGAYDKASLRLTREAGFACACTTDETPVTRHADPFCLPRIAVQDWPADEFEKRLVNRFVVAEGT